MIQSMRKVLRRGSALLLSAGLSVSLAVSFPSFRADAAVSFQTDVYSADASASGIQSEYAVVTDADSGRIVAGKNQDAVINPASMTKIMTLLVACEHVTDLSAPVTISQDAIDIATVTGLSRVGFVAGETVTVADLLYGTILPSGADAAIMLGRYVAGSDDAFVALMNEKAAELGLTSTHFANCHGMTAEGHYTTCTEMAEILAAAEENETALKVLSTMTYTTTPTVQHPSGIEVENLFLSRMSSRSIPGTLVGAKTGYTRAAMCCAASCFVSQSGKHYICVTAHAPSALQAVSDQALLYNLYANADYETSLASQTGTETSVPVLTVVATDAASVLAEQQAAVELAQEAQTAQAEAAEKMQEAQEELSAAKASGSAEAIQAATEKVQEASAQMEQAQSQADAAVLAVQQAQFDAASLGSGS